MPTQLLYLHVKHKKIPIPLPIMEALLEQLQLVSLFRHAQFWHNCDLNKATYSLCRVNKQFLSYLSFQCVEYRRSGILVTIVALSFAENLLLHLGRDLGYLGKLFLHLSQGLGDELAKKARPDKAGSHTLWTTENFLTLSILVLFTSVRASRK